MRRSAHAIVTIVLIISQLCSVLALESTGPAFMWSSHVDMDLKETVNYQTLSSKDLARSVMATGGWSNILCEGERLPQALDVAVVFFGKELHSLDISRRNADAALVDLLKDSFTKSNFSMAYPYVSTKVKEGTLENALVEEFEDVCEHKLGVNNIVVSESCSIENRGFSKVASMHSVQDYVASMMKRDIKGQPDLLVVCHGGFNSLEKIDQPHSEGAVLSELISSLDNSGAKYTFLYVSDPFNPIKYPSAHQIGRLLAEGSSRNGSLNSTLCDGVCQIKKSLLEAVFVAIVLLIILISGLCCMMGIDTPSRFETPQES